MKKRVAKQRPQPGVVVTEWSLKINRDKVEAPFGNAVHRSYMVGSTATMTLTLRGRYEDLCVITPEGDIVIRLKRVNAT